MYTIRKGFEIVYISDDYVFKTYIDYESNEPLYTENKPYTKILNNLISQYDLEDVVRKFVNKYVHGNYDSLYVELFKIDPMLDVDVVCIYKDKNKEIIRKHTDLLHEVKFETKHIRKRVNNNPNDYVTVPEGVHNVPISVDKDHTAILYMYLNSDVKIDVDILTSNSKNVEKYIRKVEQDLEYLSDVIFSLNAGSFVEDISLFISSLSSDTYPQTFLYFYETDDDYEIYKFILEEDKVIYGKVNCLNTIKDNK